MSSAPAQQEGTRRRFLGRTADLDPKGEGDRSLPGERRRCSTAETERRGTRVIWRKLDCLKPNLQRLQDPIRRKAPGTGVAPCILIGGQSMQPSASPDQTDETRSCRDRGAQAAARA